MERWSQKKKYLFDTNGISKGLFVIAQELKIIPIETLAKDLKFNPLLRDLVAEHPAFEVTSKLEQLAKEYEALVI